MPNTKKLLSITNLKKYFPVAKTSIFQKEQLYVRANEDISLDIYEGETLGIVGESGCGKSTLGRVILQLYPQTAGMTMYYGTTLAEMTPDYEIDTILKLDKYKAGYEKKLRKKEEAERKVNEAGGQDNATFFQIQDMNLASAEEHTALNHIVRIVGGFFVYDPEKRGCNLMIREFEANKRRNALLQKLKLSMLEKEAILQVPEESRNNREIKKLEKIENDISKLNDKIGPLTAQIAEIGKELANVRGEYASNEEFARYEAMREEGIDLSRLKYSEMRTLRKDIQIIFQDPYSSLNPRFTIGQIIEEGLTTHNFFRHGSEKMKEYILETMRKCGLQDYMLHRYPHQFSGGQRQRVAIARALALNPKFIVCDECVSALDVSIQSQIINLLGELKKTEKLTYMFISHDLSVVRYISDRICVMYLGNVMELTDAATMFKDPRHPYTVALLSAIPTTDQESLKKERIMLEGNIPSPIKPPSGCKFHTRCYMACDKCKRVPPELREVEPGHFVACHFPEKKIDENGNYLFELPKMVQKTGKEENNQ